MTGLHDQTTFTNSRGRRPGRTNARVNREATMALNLTP